MTAPALSGSTRALSPSRAAVFVLVVAPEVVPTVVPAVGAHLLHLPGLEWIPKFLAQEWPRWDRRCCGIPCHWRELQVAVAGWIRVACWWLDHCCCCYL